MENQVKNQRITTTITGKIGDVQVNINYENKQGEKPANINANCSITTDGDVVKVTYINVSKNANGHNVSINGDKAVAEVSELIESIKTELDAAMAAEGSVA